MELAWGKAQVQYAKLNNGTPGEFKAFPYSVEDSLQLNPTKGDKLEATIEGGEPEAVKYKRNKYDLVFEIRQGNEDGTPRKKPIEDEDGVIAGEYALKIRPEDPEVEGIQIDRCVLSCEDSFNTADGGRWRYTVDVLKPNAGNQIKWAKISAIGAE